MPRRQGSSTLSQHLKRVHTRGLTGGQPDRQATDHAQQNGGTHDDLTEGLRKNTRELSEDEMSKLFAEV